MPKQIPFLQRQTYRRRRLMDAARLLPVLGLFLWMVPMLWDKAPAPDAPGTSRAILYLFGVWIVLMVGALWVSARLRQDDRDAPQGPPEA